ncbi:MAG: serine/threonine-protein kinase [Firmicutes bacterium]|nr:serine/threonine-protein kinase [Bacillota bacterium]
MSYTLEAYITSNKLIYSERTDYLNLANRLSVSYYQVIAVLDEPHQIYLVQHQETHKIYVKKILDVYNIDIYKQLHTAPVTGTPRIIEYCEENNQLIVIEEFISGESLEDKINNASFTVEDILHYMLDLCDILEKFHSMEPAIIHRDIKPSNVIITNYNRAVLLDFNAAKYYSAQSKEDTVLLGTHGYAAPEQYGFGASSPQTDIYSLGVMLKEMLASIHNSVNHLDIIADTCTQLDPAKRYQSVADLKRELCLSLPTQPSIKKSRNPSRFLPPGYRTRKPWKMFIASMGYLFISWLGLTLEVDQTYGFTLWLERIFCLAMMLFIVFGCFNYLDIQRLIPLCKHKNRFVHYLGIVLLDISIVVCLLTVMLILESLFSL